MKTRILIPTDFSDYANAAASAAQYFTTKLDAQLFFLHCIEPSEIKGKLDNRAAETDPRRSTEGQLAQTLYDRLLFQERINPGKANLSIVVGDVVDEIADATRSLAIDYVFMGAHGTTGIKESILGSKAEQVIRQLDCPVILFQKSFKKEIKKVLFLSDYAIEAEPKCLEAAEFTKQLGAELVLGNIDLPGFFGAPNYFVKKSMVAFRAKLEGVPTTMYMQRAGSFEEGVQRMVRNREIDLVIIPTHRRSKFSQLIYESFSTALVGEINVPIMTMLM